MELNKTRRWFYALTLLWVVMLLGLGSWWLYLVFKLHTSLSLINLPEIGSQAKFLNMMKWEGSFFFIFLTLLGGSLFIMYIRDMKKTKAMQAFFASLSHELKTPLASMRLQSEVIKDLIEDETHSHEQLADLASRLIEDTSKLESELVLLDEASAQEYMTEVGIKESGLNKLIKNGYKLLGLQTYFTAGPKEVRAWTIRTGTKAPQAAGVIHTDFEKGFISADIISFEDLIKAGSYKNAKTLGVLRNEGKAYIMQDGDVVEFKFNV
jgi:signal transduction histidine kinase